MCWTITHVKAETTHFCCPPTCSTALLPLLVIFLDALAFVEADCEVAVLLCVEMFAVVLDIKGEASKQ
jgi:hypothetical protein